MSRESSHLTPSELKEEAAELIYVPTTQERKLKARFWARAAENPLVSLKGSNVSLVSIKQMTGSGAQLDAAWKKPGFQNWFLNADDGRAKMEYLFDLGLDALEELLMNPDPKTSSAKVNAVKLLAELSGRYIKGKQGNVAGIGEAIANADKASLEALFESAGLKIAVSASKGQPDEAINVTPEKD
jgi:hypothetical protein